MLSLASWCSWALTIIQVTNPIFPLKPEGEGPNEVTQGKNIIDAAKEAGVKFFIFTYVSLLLTIKMLP
jgi:hypothetical protein